MKKADLGKGELVRIGGGGTEVSLPSYAGGARLQESRVGIAFLEMAATKSDRGYFLRR